MALFNEAFIQAITTLVQQRHQALGVALGQPPVATTPAQLSAEAPLQRDLALLMRVANGAQARTQSTNVMLHRVEQALSSLIALLFGNVLQTHVTIPDNFWQTEAGILVSRVRWWLSADDLITISNAAALAFGENTQANRMRMARAMERGLLEWIPDPSVANPQQNRRVLRSQVERMREQFTLPE